MITETPSAPHPPGYSPPYHPLQPCRLTARQRNPSSPKSGSANASSTCGSRSLWASWNWGATPASPRASCHNSRTGRVVPTLRNLARIAMVFSKDLNYFFEPRAPNSLPCSPRQGSGAPLRSPAFRTPPTTSRASATWFRIGNSIPTSPSSFPQRQAASRVRTSTSAASSCIC